MKKMKLTAMLAALAIAASQVTALAADNTETTAGTGIGILDTILDTIDDAVTEVKKSLSDLKTDFANAGAEARQEILAAIAEAKAAAGNTDIDVFVDGLDIDFSQYDNVLPKIVEDRTLVPLRAAAEKLGAEVAWDADTRTITITKGDNVLILTIGETDVLLNGKIIANDVAPEIDNDRTLVPIRVVSELLGADVEWDENSRTIVIDSNTDADDTAEIENAD